MTSPAFVLPAEYRRRVTIDMANRDAANVFCDAVEANCGAWNHRLPDQFAVTRVYPGNPSTTIFYPISGLDNVLKSIGLLSHDVMPVTSNGSPVTVTVKNGAGATIVAKTFNTSVKFTDAGFTNLGTLANASISGDDGPVTVTFSGVATYPDVDVVIRYAPDVPVVNPKTIPVRVRRIAGEALGSLDLGKEVCDLIEAVAVAEPGSFWLTNLSNLQLPANNQGLADYPIYASDQQRTIASIAITDLDGITGLTNGKAINFTVKVGSNTIAELSLTDLSVALHSGEILFGTPDVNFSTIAPGDVVTIDVTPDVDVSAGGLLVAMYLNT